MIINKTRSYCCECQKEHEAIFENIDNMIFFKVFCPNELKIVKISSDAEIFLSVRKKSYCNYTNEEDKHNYSWENFVEITNDCNFSCPACFAAFKNDNKFYIPFSKFTDKLDILKKNKRYAITISGGEPTLHPDLFRMIKISSKRGITPKILTNGSILAKYPDFSKKLKKNGIEYCIIQFDSLIKENNKIIRNNDFIDLKKDALKNAKNADLFVGVNALILKEN
ncbi:MAG TPA: radical SAM protein, partial [Spirochaetota bacterium]|nr:radical SAM protein [Spirochaetota bacterium]